MINFLTLQLRLLYLFARAAEGAVEPHRNKWYLGVEVGGGGGGGGNSSIDVILFYDFHQFSLGSNNLRGMILSQFYLMIPSIDRF